MDRSLIIKVLKKSPRKKKYIIIIMNLLDHTFFTVTYLHIRPILLKELNRSNFRELGQIKWAD